jgi:hypothetical protein
VTTPVRRANTFMGRADDPAGAVAVVICSCRVMIVDRRLDTCGTNDCTTVITTVRVWKFPAKLTTMTWSPARFLVVSAMLGLLPATAAAQNFAAVGTRAAGMGGAFVGVADDATAIYWNPAGLASGSFFSLVLDNGSAKATPDALLAGAERSNFMIALTTPALGLGYYRLHTQSARTPLLLLPAGEAMPDRNLSVAGEIRLDSLVSHHAGVTIVQSLTQGVAVGATLKLVRGIASSQLVTADSPEAALEGPDAEVLGRASNQLDADIGIVAYGGPLRVGLAVRNLREPSFETAGADGELTLQRQARLGASYAVTSGWLAAADLDLTRSADVFGERRDLALGVEGRLARRAFVRSGVRLNTLDDDGTDDSRRLAYSLGGSYAVRASVYVDGHYTTGGDRTGREWGVAARFVY